MKLRKLLTVLLALMMILTVVFALAENEPPVDGQVESGEQGEQGEKAETKEVFEVLEQQPASAANPGEGGESGLRSIPAVNQGEGGESAAGNAGEANTYGGGIVVVSSSNEVKVNADNNTVIDQTKQSPVSLGDSGVVVSYSPADGNIPNTVTIDGNINNQNSTGNTSGLQILDDSGKKLDTVVNGNVNSDNSLAVNIQTSNENSNVSVEIKGSISSNATSSAALDINSKKVGSTAENEGNALSAGTTATNTVIVGTGEENGNITGESRGFSISSYGDGTSSVNMNVVATGTISGKNAESIFVGPTVDYNSLSVTAWSIEADSYGNISNNDADLQDCISYILRVDAMFGDVAKSMTDLVKLVRTEGENEVQIEGKPWELADGKSMELYTAKADEEARMQVGDTITVDEKKYNVLGVKKVDAEGKAVDNAGKDDGGYYWSSSVLKTGGWWLRLILSEVRDPAPDPKPAPQPQPEPQPETKQDPEPASQPQTAEQSQIGSTAEVKQLKQTVTYINTIQMPKDFSCDDADAVPGKLSMCPDELKKRAKQEIEALQRNGYKISFGFGVWAKTGKAAACTVKLSEDDLKVKDGETVFVNGAKVDVELKDGYYSFNVQLPAVVLIVHK